VIGFLRPTREMFSTISRNFVMLRLRELMTRIFSMGTS
jgi:hypothetical protein